uniref:CHAD domain containing protein n=1 Tax=uncultured Nocardioidaceae bacterium TaxID=253824 RepID=A0A6J4L536_9ACTN|nr:MAG: CHAD domain containing protein [uncultured Nocardioidaceae bacterium]
MVSRRQVETERTYDVPEELTVLPDVVAATDGAIASVTDVGTDDLEATYVDTDDLRLIGRRVTLRRRTGGPDAGWHLKLPVKGDTRQEIHWPLGDGADVPDDVRVAVTALAAGSVLRPVVRLATSRRRRLLSDQAGVALAELLDDQVSATMLDGTSAVTVWREIEVELIDGTPAHLDAVEAALMRAGAQRAAVSSKLARALAGHPALVDGRPLGSGTAGDVLLAYVREQADRLRWADVDLRLDPDGEGVHDMRVQARRLRTALRVNRPLVEQTVGRHLEQELQLLGRVLSPVRDHQVSHDLMAARARSLAPDREARLLSLFENHRASADERSVSGMQAALGAGRYLRLLQDLDGLAAGQGLTGLAAEPAGPVLAAHVRTALRRLGKAAKAVRRATPAERSDRLHDLRKSAKTLRYACEVAEPVHGPSAQLLGQRAKALQTLLGDHLDRVLLAEQLEPLTHAKGATAGDGFLLGSLYGELSTEISAGSKKQARALRRVRSQKATAWLH